MKQRIFSGVQPSGNLHIGNYLGAIKNWVDLQDAHENIFCVVDLHAITVPQEPTELRKRIREVANMYLAAGIDPKKSTIFVQSDRPEHSELAWILNCFTYMGELSRMTQFKDKASIQVNDGKDLLDNAFIRAYEKMEKRKLSENEVGAIRAFERAARKESVSVGLFDYPVLMAADILLYQSNLVPVGKDQYQHIEITRDIAERINKKFGQIFTMPKSYSTAESLTIMGLDDPLKKMAKSAKSEYNYIALRDTEDAVRKKIAKAVTDSGTEIKYDPDKKPALTNLINIYGSFSDKSPKEIEKSYKGKGYKGFKEGLAEVIIDFLKPFQKKLVDLEKDPGYTEKILKEGAEKLAPQAKETLQKVKKAIGLGL